MAPPYKAVPGVSLLSLEHVRSGALPPWATPPARTCSAVLSCVASRPPAQAGPRQRQACQNIHGHELHAARWGQAGGRPAGGPAASSCFTPAWCSCLSYADNPTLSHPLHQRMAALRSTASPRRSGRASWKAPSNDVAGALVEMPPLAHAGPAVLFPSRLLQKVHLILLLI